MDRRDDRTESWPLVAHLLSTVRVRFKDHPTARPPRVLVVDDEESVRHFAETALGGAGYEVTVAFDGLDALRVVDKHAPFDLFVIDLTMPRMTGDELAGQLRQSDPDVKILYLAETAAPSVMETKTREREAVLEKPVTTRDLTEAASRLLFGHGRGPRSSKD